MISASPSVAHGVGDREIRAALPRDSQHWTAENYADYLQTPWWRKRRNQALADAGWTCERCLARKGLQVHHRSYTRLGAELREDLEVLCRTCHEGEHLSRDQQQHAGVYFKLVREVVRSGRFERLADLFDAVKDACAAARVPYDSDAVTMVVRDIDARAKGVVDAPRPVTATSMPARDLRPVGHQEAVAILRRLNVTIGLREMPKAATLEPGAVDAFKQENGLWR